MKNIINKFAESASDRDFKYKLKKLNNGQDCLVVYREPFSMFFAYIAVKDKLVKAGRAIGNINEETKSLHVRLIKVEEDFQHKGVGKALVNSMIDYAKETNCSKIDLVAARKVVDFYKSLGFDCVSKNGAYFSDMEYALGVKNEKELL